MNLKSRGWTLVGMLLVAGMLSAPAMAQIATTQLTDTVYHADGTPATGTVLVSWPAFTTAGGQAVPGGSTSSAIGAGGALSVALAPNAGATPMGSYYTAVYHLDDGTVSREYWVIPVSGSAVKLAAVKSTVLPTSVAMQTVSNNYVDTAIAQAVLGHPNGATGAPYVQRTGDTMTGPLVLAADPTSALQAADKSYVDATVAGLQSGLAQKVSVLPQATQTVTQPAGTTLAVNNLNSAEYASQYQAGRGNNGIANATASTDCANGCEVKVEATYEVGAAKVEGYSPSTWNSSTLQGTHVEDLRGGSRRDSYFNPVNVLKGGDDVGQAIDVVSTRSAVSSFAATGGGTPASTGLFITHEGLTGGTNLFPQSIDAAVPYFKSTYSAANLTGTYNTMGQHVLEPMNINCYGVGDCLIGSQFLTASGGFRDEADEGAHPFDLQIQEDKRVFQGTCSAGCATGATSVTVAVTSAPGTQGEGRYLIDKNPAKVISAGSLMGGAGATAGKPGPTAQFQGTSFPVSVFLATGVALTSQPNNVAPGTVTVAIATTGLGAVYATTTAALPATSGVACVADVPNAYRPNNYEMANYTVIDATHLQMTLNKAHAAGSTIAVGGLCGYGLEQTVDTANGIRQVFPVIGSSSATSLFYAGGTTPVVGVSGQTSAFLNVQLPVASIARQAGVVTVTTSGNMPADLNGLTLTVSGVTDASYNGSFAVTTTGPNTLTYAAAGPDSTSTGGSVAVLTGGYALYPMAEVLGVYNAATKAVDGQLTLAPNTVAWAANDVVEEPHYFQEQVAGDTEFIGQTTPRPSWATRAGVQYQGNNGPGLTGWSVANATPAASYLGNGGTHTVPDAAYEATGIWRRTMQLQAGEQSVFSVHCNSHGCGKWNSGYNLFELDSAVGTDVMGWSPNTSSLTLNLRGAAYTFAPQGMTASTINATTVNATTVNGAVNASSIATGTIGAARLPVFGASGASHVQGAVPDPGATAGTTRFLREDGAWIAPPAAGVSGASAGVGLPGGISADYNFLQGAGTVLTDNSGNGNNGTLAAGALAPTWTRTGMVFSGQQGVALPAALNGTQTFFLGVYINPVSAGLQPSNQYPVLVSSTGGTQGFNLMYDTETGLSGQFLPWRYAPTLFANGQLKTTTTYSISGFHVIAVVLGQSGVALDKMYIDGHEVTTYARHGISSGAQTSGNLFLGSSNVGPWATSGFNGTAYRMITYPTMLGDGDVLTVSAAIRNEVANRGVATSPLPVSLIAPQLHLVGDSITYGYNVATPWPSLLALTNQPPYTVTNWGIPGISLQELVGSEPNRAALQCQSIEGPAMAVVFAGTNDFAITSYTTVPDVFATLMGEVQTLKQAGCRVFVGTMLSRGGTDRQGRSIDADKDLFDSLILTQAKISGADGVVDFAANALLGADGAFTNQTYFQPDGTHPTQAGQALLAQAASNALNYAFGFDELNPHAVTTLPYTMAAGDGYISLNGLTGAGSLTLPDCTGQSGAVYRVNNPQAAFTVTVAPANGAQRINGLSSVTVPANGTLTLRDVPNPKTVSGCHWDM